MYKLGQISKEAYKKCEVEITDKGKYIEDIQKQNQIAIIGHRFLINAIQKNKNTDTI